MHKIKLSEEMITKMASLSRYRRRIKHYHVGLYVSVTGVLGLFVTGQDLSIAVAGMGASMLLIGVQVARIHALRKNIQRLMADLPQVEIQDGRK